MPGVWQRILAGVFLAGHQPIHIDTHGGGLWDHRRLTESIGLVRRHPDQHKTTPSFLDALAALRKVLWAQRITVMSSPSPDDTKITEALLDTLAYAA